MSGVFTIPSDHCFVTALAQGLWEEAAGDPIALASMTVYLPTRRSCRHLQDAFLRVTGARAALLPQLRALGDVEEDGASWLEHAALGDIPPAIPALRRQMLLIEQVKAKDPAMPYDQAASLAVALAGLLDQAQTEGCDLDKLETLVPQEHAAHWQDSLTFLSIVMEHWPAVLAAEKALDPVQRRNLILGEQARLWQVKPPSGPLYAAGSTGSHPAVGALMRVLAGLPNGCVILPGLDLSLDEESWQAVSDTHPQYTMKQWLESSAFERKKVQLWRGCSNVGRMRTTLMQEAMRPAETTDQWQRLSPEVLSTEAFENFEMLTLDTHREEAEVIALKLRATLEVEGKTAALVTPDRALALRVATALSRWDITINDSAGTPLHQWPVGSFLLHVLAVAGPQASPVDFLALLKHPLAAVKATPAQCRQYARKIEVIDWRGIRPCDPLKSAALSLAKTDSAGAEWVSDLASMVQPLCDKWAQVRPLSEWIALHAKVAEELATTDDEAGEARLWRGEDGRSAAEWIHEWQSCCTDRQMLTGADYLALFRALSQQVVVRPAFGQHPRLSLLGPLEARLLHYDVVILGGLNEGTWPPAPPVDPWLSRPMKKALGLPSPDRRIGLSAHDFVQLCGAGDVLLTRAQRVEGSLTVPSRLWMQIEAVLQAAGHDLSQLVPTEPWHAWAEAMDAAGRFSPMEKPEPKPPVNARPTSLSVTEIGKWRRNPYAIYAKHVLKLNKLEDLDAAISAARFGTQVHAALEAFMRAVDDTEQDAWASLLLEKGREAFAPFENRPQVSAFWWPRFQSMANWFVKNEIKRRAEGYQTIGIESYGKMDIVTGAFSLRGRADRIDRGPDGSLTIIDYKTGSLPATKAILAGYDPQLALLAMMAAGGAFEKIAPAVATSLEHWAVMQREEKGIIKPCNKDLEGQVNEARVGLEALVHAFSDPATPYQVEPKPSWALTYNDYAHLSRIAEWGDKK